MGKPRGFREYDRFALMRTARKAARRMAGRGFETRIITEREKGEWPHVLYVK